MKKIIDIILKHSKNTSAYIVGGWLRDKFLKRENRDLDIAVSANPKKIAEKVSKSLSGRLVHLDEDNSIYRVVLKNNKHLSYIDFAKLKGPTIEKDLLKRDFTVDSIAIELKNYNNLKKIIDPCSGVKDIRKKTIRATYKNVFHDDSLRLLRAYRLAAELDFSIDPRTQTLIKTNAKRISKSAWERIKDELFRILSQPDGYKWIEKIDSTGILETLMPEIKIMKRSCRSYYYHPKGLWQHTMLTLKSFENIAANLDDYFPDHYKKIQDHLDQPLSAYVTRAALIKAVALLHDIAKPDCAEKYKNKMRFIGHEEKGAVILEKVFKRIRLSSDDIKRGSVLILNHMRPISLTQTSTLTQRASFRFFRDIGDNSIDLLLLAMADWHSYKGLRDHSPSELKKQEIMLSELVDRYYKGKEKPALPKIIDGNILMKKFKIKPGPIIGKILKEIHERQHLGKIKTQKEALAVAKRFLPRK